MNILKVLKNIFFPNYSKILSDGMKDAEVNKGNPCFYLKSGKYLIYSGLFLTLLTFIFYKFSPDDLGILIYIMLGVSLLLVIYGIYMIIFKEKFAIVNKQITKETIDRYKKYLLPLISVLFIYSIFTNEINKLVASIYIFIAVLFI